MRITQEQAAETGGRPSRRPAGCFVSRATTAWPSRT